MNLVTAAAAVAAESVHILGLGNIGRFFAHNLQLQLLAAAGRADDAKTRRKAPISLLFHRKSLQEEWNNVYQQISISKSESIRTPGSPAITATTSSISAEYIIESITPPKLGDPPIQNLILATKGHKALDALGSIKHRLTRQTTILFVQGNGLETISKINHKIFPDPSTRPSYLMALVSHGLISNGPFSSTQSVEGLVLLRYVSKPSVLTSILLNRILEAPGLNASYVDGEDFHKIKLESLVISATINPLTALFRCQNGQLFWVGIVRKPVKSLMRCLVKEINQVFLNLDCEEGAVDTDRFTVRNMELTVCGTARKTRYNVSPMLQDIIQGEETEIDSINGWVVEEGEKRGLDVRCNRTVIELIKKKEKLNEDQIESHFPGTISCQEMNSWNQALSELYRNGFKTSKKFLYNKHKKIEQAW